MAESGRININAGINPDTMQPIEAGYLDWSVTSQSAINNTSTVSWELYVTNPLPDDYLVVTNYTIGRIDSNPQQVLSQGTSNLVLNVGASGKAASGSFTISHNASGALSFTLAVNVNGSSYWGGVPGVFAGGATITLPTIKKEAIILSASNFTDEQYPVLTYSNPADGMLQACISLDGTTDSIPYRAIARNGSSYTFSLTDTERNTLRAASTNKTTVSVTYIIKCTVNNVVYYTKAIRTCTITNSKPVIKNATVKDIKPETLALTGNANKIVLHESMVEYSFEPEALKQATITTYSVQCGSKTITDMTAGVIDDVESRSFIFSATDSRNQTTKITVDKSYVAYLKPTCYQTITTEIEGETGAKVNLTIHGNYFHGSFGAVNNTLKLEVRHTQNDGTMGDWVDLSPLGYTYEGNTYELTTSITGLSYSQSYTFQCRATDKLNVVQSAQYVVKVLPIFDWDNDDFNFNVPVNMNGETVLRHNKDADNTVLSGSGGSIYLRPNGTDSTSGQVQIKSDGTLILNGGISFGDDVGDFVVESGSTAMGSNGTWYWEKWNSGKAVCWGSRNFGRMSVNTAWGALFRSGYQTQNLPSGLFNASPTNVHIQIDRVTYSEGTFPGFAMNSEKTSSQLGFVVVNAVSGTLSESYIDFHIIGRWK